MNIHIRKATEKDLPALTEMSAALIESDGRFDKTLTDQWAYEEDGQNYLRKRIKGRNCICIVAESNGKIIGYTTGALLTIEKWRPVNRAEMDNLFISDEYRNQGVGSKLIDTFIAWSMKKKVDRVMLHVVAQNDKALEFYKRNHFEPQHIILERILSK